MLFTLPYNTSTPTCMRRCPQFAPPQHSSEQHSKHPRHARAAQACIMTIAHWSFILLHALMKHMQQKQSATRLQQPTAFSNISNFSGGLISPNPVVRFSLVAVTSPNPSVRPRSGIADRSSGLLCFIGLFFAWSNTEILVTDSRACLALLRIEWDIRLVKRRSMLPSLSIESLSTWEGVDLNLMILSSWENFNFIQHSCKSIFSNGPIKMFKK